MKRILLALCLLGLVGCTDIKVDGPKPPKPKDGSRIKVVEFNRHGSIDGRLVNSLILRDTKTEKEFLVVESTEYATITRLSD
jgi:hypothetical protein